MLSSSIFFLFINSTLARLQTFYYHSMAYRFYLMLKESFETSFSLRIFTRIEAVLKRASKTSAIWGVLSRPSALTAMWENSLFCRMLNLPGKLFAALYSKVAGVFEKSVVYRILSAFFDRQELVIGATIAAIVSVPDHMWYNMYALILTTALLLLHLIKVSAKVAGLSGFRRMDFPLFAFFFALILSALTSVLLAPSLNAAVLYTVNFLLALIIIDTLLTKDAIIDFSVMLAFAAVAMGLYGIYQWKIVGVFLDTAFVDTRLYSDMQGRIFATMGNPNIFAEALLLTVPFLFSAFFNAETIGKKAFYLCMSLPPMLCLYLTGSRSAWGAFAVACVAYLFLVDRRLVPFGFLLGISALPLLPIFVPSFYNRLITAFNTNDTSRVYREYIFTQATYMLKDYWSCGVGLGIDAFRSVFLNYVNIYYKNVIHTHNSYMQLWLESGISALAFFVWAVLRQFKTILRVVFDGGDQGLGVDAALKIKNQKLRNVSASAAMSLVGIIAMGFFDNIWFYNRITMLIFVVFALIIAIGHTETAA